MSFSLLLSSNNGTKVVGTTNNQIVFSHDFSVHRHTGRYKLTYMFLSGGGLTLIGTDNLLILHNLPVSSNTYDAGSTNQNGAIKSLTLGTTSIQRLTATDSFYSTPFNHSIPTIIKSLPVGPQKFTITLNNIVTDALETKLLLTPYELYLYFEAINEPADVEGNKYFI
jgi:hypothetical protein